MVLREPTAGGVLATSAITFVLGLLNTFDRRTHGTFRATLVRDELVDRSSATAWLVQSDLWQSRDLVPESTTLRLRTIRDGLLQAFTTQDSGFLMETRVVLSLDDRVTPTLSAGVGDEDAVVSAVGARLIAATLSVQWARIRVCAAPDCQHAFFDSSRGGRARWCSMRSCGNRMKTRAYRLRRSAGESAKHMPVTPPPPRRHPTNVFRRDGDYWTIAFSGRGFHLKDSKGLQCLSRLLAEPGREFHALDLAAPTTSGDPAGAARRSVIGSPLIDDRARLEYRARIDELRSEVDEAEAWNDPARLERAKAEMEFVAGELRRSVGLSGRERAFASDSERARISVTRVIKAALARIADESPELKHHFASAIRTGTYCSYNPDRRLPVHWEL